jgi:hypothetical protein
LQNRVRGTFIAFSLAMRSRLPDSRQYRRVLSR